ncbi:MAG: Asp23/Gls24 family envelope stress response protein, partial [Candidatus Omnitrophota bacterium]|nr:Asp23/Gls24 family envelope stress response protein [Candidatus Omnitrophota bacterium]
MSKAEMHRDRSTDLGVVRINNEAIMTISSIAAMEVRGVHRMGGGLRRALYDSLFNKPSSGGVRIHMKESEVKL